MNKRYNRKEKRIIALFVFVFGFLVLLPLKFPKSEYLSKNEKVDANLLIVEGWLQPYALNLAKTEFRKNGYNLIITTGLNTPEYFSVFSNGYLIFYTGTHDVVMDNYDNHTIEVDAYSKMGGHNRAHFNFFVNDSLVAGFYAGKQKRKYRIKWEGKVTQIDSIMIQFDNDGFVENGDMNLFVKGIVIDKKITIPYQNNSEFNILSLDKKNRIVNDFDSFAEKARNELIFMGIDTSQIMDLPGNEATINRTLSSALAVRLWLETSDYKVKGINIVSVGTHSRRTWMIYKKVLDNSFNIGIIAIPDNKNNYSRIHKIFQTFRETLGLIYYWIILIPY